MRLLPPRHRPLHPRGQPVALPLPAAAGVVDDAVVHTRGVANRSVPIAGREIGSLGSREFLRLRQRSRRRAECPPLDDRRPLREPKCDAGGANRNDEQRHIESVSIHLRSAGFGTPNKNPCTSSQPCSTRNCSCSSVSTPSAVTARSRPCAICTIAEMIARLLRLVSIACTNS